MSSAFTEAIGSSLGKENFFFHKEWSLVGFPYSDGSIPMHIRPALTELSTLSKRKNTYVDNSNVMGNMVGCGG